MGKRNNANRRTNKKKVKGGGNNKNQSNVIRAYDGQVPSTALVNRKPLTREDFKARMEQNTNDALVFLRQAVNLGFQCFESAATEEEAALLKRIIESPGTVNFRKFSLKYPTLAKSLKDKGDASELTVRMVHLYLKHLAGSRKKGSFQFNFRTDTDNLSVVTALAWLNYRPTPPSTSDIPLLQEFLYCIALAQSAYYGVGDALDLMDVKVGASFRQNCLFTGLTAVGWDILGEVIFELGKDYFEGVKEQVDASKVSITLALSGVLRGLDVARDTCWQCGHWVEELWTCSACLLYRYCSKECQLTSWKNGHQLCCSSTRPCIKLYEQAFARVKQVNSSGSVHSIHTCPRIDLTVAELFGQPLPWPSIAWNDGVEPDGPSMEYFYHNLSAIFRDEWFFFPTNANNGKRDGILSQEQKEYYLETVLPRLCFDLEGAMRKNILSGKESSKPLDVQDLFHPTRDALFQIEKSAWISREELLNFATRENPHEYTPSDLKVIERNFKWAAYEKMRIPSSVRITQQRLDPSEYGTVEKSNNS